VCASHHGSEDTNSICLAGGGAPGHPYEGQGGYSSQVVKPIGFDCWCMRAENSSWTSQLDAVCTNGLILAVSPCQGRPRNHSGGSGTPQEWKVSDTQPRSCWPWPSQVS
jgi:hypothetical protein